MILTLLCFFSTSNHLFPCPTVSVNFYSFVFCSIVTCNMHCKQHKLSRWALFVLRANVVKHIVWINEKMGCFPFNQKPRNFRNRRKWWGNILNYASSLSLRQNQLTIRKLCLFLCGVCFQELSESAPVLYQLCVSTNLKIIGIIIKITISWIVIGLKNSYLSLTEDLSRRCLSFIIPLKDTI